MNNTYFGKAMENVRDRTILEFFPHSENHRKMKRQSKFSSKCIVNQYPEYSVYKYTNGSIVFEDPIYLGFGVLEFSKLLMYEFYYDKF